MEDEKPATNATRQPIMLAVAGAVGMAVLGLAGTIGVEMYKGWATQAETDRKKNEEVAATLPNLSREFESIGDTVAAAIAYIETGKDGTAADVRRVARHFRKLLASIRGGIVTRAAAASAYGGRIEGWSNRFALAGAEDRPAGTGRFSANERNDFRLLSAALLEIAEAAPAVTATDAINSYWAAANTTSSENSTTE